MEDRILARIERDLQAPWFSHPDFGSLTLLDGCAELNIWRASKSPSRRHLNGKDDFWGCASISIRLNTEASPWALKYKYLVAIPTFEFHINFALEDRAKAEDFVMDRFKNYAPAWDLASHLEGGTLFGLETTRACQFIDREEQSCSFLSRGHCLDCH